MIVLCPECSLNISDFDPVLTDGGTYYIDSDIVVTNKQTSLKGKVLVN